MSDLQKPIPGYLTEKKNIVSLILFTSVFALVFINIYAPFDVKSWDVIHKYDISTLEFFIYSSLIILTGVFVVVISRVLMYQRCKNNRTLQLQSYILWVLTEVFFMALFYSIFELLVLKDPREFSEVIKVSLLNTALVLFIPYSVSWLYFSYQEKKAKLQMFEQDSTPVEQQNSMIPFYDEKGVLRFSLKKDNLLYLESSDNYVKIHYLNKGVVTQFLLRNTLKQMEEFFKDSDILRAHRSYMVNFDKVKIIRKEKDGLKLELDTPDAFNLPVSKTYVENVMNKFSSVIPSGKS